MAPHKSYAQIEDDFSAYPHESNPDPQAFVELALTKSSLRHHMFSTTGPNSGPLYAVTTSSPFARAIPAVSLHSTTTRDSPPLGVVWLGFWRKHNIGFRAEDNEEYFGTKEEMDWLKMFRVNLLNFKEFDFEFEGKSYIWRTLRAAPYGERPDIELREKGAGGGGETLLAFYKGERRREKLRTWRGVFFLRGKSWSEARELKLGAWELVVIMTGLGVVEAAGREAARRKTAG